MDRPKGCYTDQSKSDREKNISYDNTHMWNSTFKTDTNEFLYKTETVLLLSKTNLWLPKLKHQEKDKSGA